MVTNPYFNNFGYSREQDLIEDLTIESIKVYGHDVRYIPRTIVKEDDLFGEDVLSQFNDAVEIEMYIKNVEGFEGEGDFLSKFNLEIRDQITFTVARKRFDQARSEKLTTENGYNLLTEEASTTTPSRQFLSTAYEGFSFELETGTSEGYSITNNRPTEGDLLYFPMVDKLFEIMFVEHETMFYQTGRLQTYDIRCELFEYSSEQIDTGISDIDKVEDLYSADILVYEMLQEDGFILQLEDGGSMMQEYRLEDTQATANNEYFSSSATDVIYNTDSILDFSEVNPFSEVDRF